jgi:hypothetical protein
MNTKKSMIGSKKIYIDSEGKKWEIHEKGFQVDEGNLKAVKDTPTWVGDNWWIFYVKTTNGRWDRVSRMDVSKIQKFFNTKLPVY